MKRIGFFVCGVVVVTRDDFLRWGRGEKVEGLPPQWNKRREMKKMERAIAALSESAHEASGAATKAAEAFAKLKSATGFSISAVAKKKKLAKKSRKGK